jgi:hypothetical protein
MRAKGWACRLACHVLSFNRIGSLERVAPFAEECILSLEVPLTFLSAVLGVRAASKPTESMNNEMKCEKQTTI